MTATTRLMLKPPEQRPQSGPDRSIGELIEQVLDDALDYGRAEVELLKATRARNRGNLRPRGDLLRFCSGPRTRRYRDLVRGIAITLGRWIGPLGGAIVSTLLAAAIAGGLAWLAMRDLKEEP